MDHPIYGRGEHWLIWETIVWVSPIRTRARAESYHRLFGTCPWFLNTEFCVYTLFLFKGAKLFMVGTSTLGSLGPVTTITAGYDMSMLVWGSIGMSG